MLEKQLDPIWIGTFKLWVNIAKSCLQKNIVPNKAVLLGPKGIIAISTVRQGVGYADAVKNNLKQSATRWIPRGAIEKKKGEQEPWNGLEHEVKEDDMSWLAKCYVGQIHIPDTMFLLQQKMIQAGLFSIKVTPMRGDLVLITVEEGEDFHELVKDVNGLFETWFCDVRPWSQKEIAKEWYAWIRCQGVPLHVGFFEKVVAGLGRYVTMDSTTMAKKRFDMAKVMVQTTSLEPVSKLVKVKNLSQILLSLHFTMKKNGAKQICLMKECRRQTQIPTSFLMMGSR